MGCGSQTPCGTGNISETWPGKSNYAKNSTMVYLGLTQRSLMKTEVISNVTAYPLIYPYRHIGVA